MWALAFSTTCVGQVVEVYAGAKRAGIDLLWLESIKNTQGERTPFLFFSRNRASRELQAKASAPTRFGSINAVSYTFKNAVGIVIVGSFLNPSFTPKAGLQYAKQKGDFLFFGWAVADLKKEGGLEVFGLFRYQPEINPSLRGFGQLELFPIYIPSSGLWNMTQRLRLGLRHQTWAAGMMADVNQFGKNSLTTTAHVGVFLRNEF